VYTEPSHSSSPVVGFCSMPLYSSSGHIVGGKHVMHELASFAGQLWQAELWLRTNTVLDSVPHNRLWAACTSGSSRVLFNQPLHVLHACRLFLTLQLLNVTWLLCHLFQSAFISAAMGYVFFLPMLFSTRSRWPHQDEVPSCL
jgi:hypothetical protein